MGACGWRFTFLAQPVYRKMTPPDLKCGLGQSGQPSPSRGCVPEVCVWTGLCGGGQPSVAWHHGNDEGLRAQIPALSPGSPTS